MGWLLLLAQSADSTDGLPSWAKWILGPLGALVIMGVYAYRTEKHRMPKLAQLLLDEQNKNDKLQKENEKEKDELRADYEGRLEKAKDELTACREKYTKERASRAWWQASAEAKGVDIESDAIMYEAVNSIRAALEGMLEPERRETVVGRATVRAVFKVSKMGSIVR